MQRMLLMTQAMVYTYVTGLCTMHVVAWTAPNSRVL